MLYDEAKPDLLIHPKFYLTIVSMYDLKEKFNLLNLLSKPDTHSSVLDITTDIGAYLVKDDGICRLNNVRLKPFYHNSSSFQGVGIKPHVTSYWFGDEMPMYGIRQNGPRYVIWPKNYPLSVCATTVDRIDEEEIFQAVKRARQWAYPITDRKSIVVFDLDDTLIDNHNNKLLCSDGVLDYAKKVYDYVVLYSHGSALHVEENALKFCCLNTLSDNTFTLILSNNGSDPKSQKNLLSLYNYLPTNIRFTKSTLVDDSLFNWTPEYGKFIIPACRNLHHVLEVL